MSPSLKPVVLCVDDDPDILHFMKALLGKQGYEVALADSGKQALMAVLRSPPDVILLDVTMADMSGYDVCARLQEREETSYIPVIMVTALTGEKDQIRALRAGAADYITKPIDPAGLLGKVESHLATRGRWTELQKATPDARSESRWDSKLRPSDFLKFKEFLSVRLKLPQDTRTALGRILPPDLYPQGAILGLSGPQIAESIADFLSIPFVSQVSPESVKLGVLPTPFCRSHSIVALEDPASPAAFVLSNPFNWEVQEAIKRALEKGQNPKLSIIVPERVEELLAPRPAPAARKQVEFSEIEAKLREEYQIEEQAQRIDAGATEQSAPIIQLINNLIDQAHARGASDIHIEPAEEEVIIRYRIDGDLAVVNRLKPARLINPMVARLKIMSSLDISEHRLPQDGRIKFKQYSSQGRDFDLRVAIAPQNHGEKVVMRIIDKQKSVLPLEQLGFSPRNLELYREKIAAPYGMILHVGPTGSGKSMTLYAALNEIKSDTINIQTAEDPIEYTLAGINQLQVKKEIGLTFARALRSFLRLDPDVILVGEIRDHETAETAIEASLTGHLLLSTLHTNDAPSTVTRFIEMGIEPYLVSSSLLLVCAQRLLRRLCKECKEPYSPDGIQKKFVGSGPDDPLTLYRPKGCERCNGAGYRGRVGVHEIFVPNDEIRGSIVKKGVTSESLKHMAVENGMTTLFWDSMEKVRQGLCSVEDTLANVKPDEFDSRPLWMKTPEKRGPEVARR
jgi:type IV pilus assembly protein PilB